MKVLVVNCGSSTVKSAIVETRDGQRIAESHSETTGEYEQAVTAALLQMDLTDVRAVGHRVVHGGTRFMQPTLLDESVLRILEESNELAPLHNPPAIAGIRAARALLPRLPHVAVFDTAFHSTLPPHAYTYAIPAELAERYSIRRFGFHGTSHAFVATAASQHLGVPAQDLRIVSCHLGNGSSITAIERGRSVETSMGMTPLEGLVMGTRGGDIDPGALLHLLRVGACDAQQLDELLNRKSGLLALAGTYDMREIERGAARGDERCELALEIFAHRARKYIGAYAAVMGGVDVIAFTGGIGENSSAVRERICRNLGFLGVSLDAERNRAVRAQRAGEVTGVSAAGSVVHVLVVAADEELAIARDVAALLDSL